MIDTKQTVHGDPATVQVTVETANAVPNIPANVHASWLRWYQDRSGCLWGWLAGQLGVSVTMLGEYRSGAGSPSEVTWRRFAAWLGRQFDRELPPAEYWGGPPARPPGGTDGLRAARDVVMAWAATTCRVSFRAELRYRGWSDDQFVSRLVGAMVWHGLISADGRPRAATPERMLSLALDMLGGEGEASLVVVVALAEHVAGPSQPEIVSALELLVDAQFIWSEIIEMKSREDPVEVVSLFPDDRFDPDSHGIDDTGAVSWSGPGPAWAVDGGMVCRILP